MTKRIRPSGHPTPWQRVVEAYEEGVGIRLSWDELAKLNQDDAIVTRAQFDDETEDGIINTNYEPAER